MLQQMFFRLINAYRFGGIKYILTIIYDEVHDTNTRAKITNRIVRECHKKQLGKKASAYFGMVMGQKINYIVPVKFNEKIQWMMLYESTSIKTRLTDKFLVREFITEKIGTQYLVPLLGVWNNYSEIDFEKLPNRFVLKCNHGSGMNIIVKDKEKIDCDSLCRQFSAWLEINYAYNNFEMQYEKIEAKIIAEEYIEALDDNLYDYKVHCFNGKPAYIQVIGNRNLKSHTAKQLVYDFGWKQQDWCFGTYPKYEYDLPKPSRLKTLYEISERLCEGFDYVRVDLYIVNDQILFGEMTFTPNAGRYVYNDDFTEDIDIMLGNMIKIHGNIK